MSAAVAMPCVSLPCRVVGIIGSSSTESVIERFSRTADTLQGSVGVKGQPRQGYVAALNADHSIATLALSVFAATAAADAAPLQRVRVTLQGDSAFADVGGQTQHGGGNRDVTVQVFPSLDHLFIPDTSGLPTGYATLTSNRLSSAVLGVLADWLVAKLAAKQRPTSH